MRLAFDEYDAIVLGAGPIGLAFAGWLKKLRPQGKVLVLEASKAPGFKIGESTLACTIRNLVELGFSYPMLRRLFHVDEGLSYWHTTEASSHLDSHVDLRGMGEAFQLERRVFDTAFIELTRRRGIEVVTGAKAILAESELNSRIKTIAFRLDNDTYAVKTKVLCDATGPARALLRQLDIDDVPLDDFNTSSYYAHFRCKREKSYGPLWERPMTRHICIPEGWMWCTNIDSWESSPDANLRRMVGRLIDLSAEDDNECPSRHQLCDQFGCDFERVVSIGFVVRKDHSMNENLLPAQAFEHYVEKYPAIRQVMSDFELVPDIYSGTPFRKRTDIARRARQVAGPGWVAVGEAAMMVDPLFSTGIDYGLEMAHFAARNVARALTNDTFHTTRAYTKYQRQVEDVFDALYRERGVYYRAFQRPQTFERILMMKLACIVPDILHKRRFADEDSLVWNALAPVWQRTIEDVHVALTSAEAGTLSEFGLLRRVRAVALGLHDKLRVWDRSRHIEWGEFFDHYGDQLQRDEYHVRGDGLHLVGQCGTCETWMTVGPEIERCPVCGGRDARATPMVTGAFETAQAAE